MATTKRDYYEILGIARTADGEEVKRAYRRLAMKYHPDRTTENKAEAEAKFKECAEAYEVLSDDAKRKRYDQFGHAGVAGMGQHDFNHMDVGDIFSMFDDIFGGLGGFGGQRGGRGGGGARARANQRGFDLETQIELTLAEVANGAEREIQFEKQDTCETCKGSGAKPGSSPVVCVQCGGQGRHQSGRRLLHLHPRGARPTAARTRPPLRRPERTPFSSSAHHCRIRRWYGLNRDGAKTRR